jgi:bacterioferritin
MIKEQGKEISPGRTHQAQLIDSLNRMLAQEHACAIRYLTHAVTISGPFAEPVGSRLKEIAGDELDHAEKLRKRIVGLGGIPTMDINAEDLKPAAELNDILEINIAEEKNAVALYSRILAGISQTDVILYEAVQDILRDEQEHLEELSRLLTP